MDYNQKLALWEPYDVVVCGGGPSGIPAALAGARAGLKTLLIESTGQLGGVGTSAGVTHLLGGRTLDNKHDCVAGIFREITEGLYARGEAIDPRAIPDEKYSPFGWLKGLVSGVPFNPIAMTALLDEKMLEAGVDVLYFTGCVDALTDGDRITHIVAFNKSGLFAVPTSAVVDATGDADMAARCGCPVVKGREEDGLMTPATLIFHVEGVDQEQTAAYIYEHESPRFREMIRSLRERGIWDFPYDIFISVQVHEKGTMMINTSRICDVDGTDGRSISRGMMRGRSETHRLMAIMREHFPGFGNARIKLVAPVLGIRETRRIVGDYVYTVQDVLDQRDFPDTIGFSGYGWDLPDPKKPSYQPLAESGKKLKRRYTPIPYRCMVPRRVTNIICPGRAISVERDVLGPLREQGPCYAMGHAAGLAAVQAVRENKPFAAVDTERLRADLRKQGAIVDWHTQA
ncbi:FAD-dependent oxidoreductase [Paenibacillus hemerocallicola]|uniref:FAD-dependent oxidoreductase n=1 Tax=Paenibacillus hemerocallicola TaxID=1172614 RepID=UPI00159ECE74|nr:FAD-dependent oxidoreductase [Paenibacillus hemerocallicola]